MKYIRSFILESYSNELSELTQQIEDLYRQKRELRAKLNDEGNQDLRGLLEIDKQLAPLEKRKKDIFNLILKK